LAISSIDDFVNGVIYVVRFCLLIVYMYSLVNLIEDELRMRIKLRDDNKITVKP